MHFLYLDELVRRNVLTKAQYAFETISTLFRMEALKNIIQCNKMVKVSCIFKGVVRAVKADQRFFKGITAGHF
jgi:hypothetical protein